MAALMQTLMEELVEEILLRLPPEDAACLLRASLVCKPWQRILSNRAFRRRYREFHGNPPMLGFICNVECANHGIIARFVPTASSCLPHDDRPGWRALNARHGRVILHRMPRQSSPRDNDFLVWDPIAGEHWELPKLPLHPYYTSTAEWNVSVLCATGATCNHLHCHPGGHFIVVFVGKNDSKMFSCVYSSQSRAWNRLNSCQCCVPFLGMAPSVLAGNALYLPCQGIGNQKEILKYDMATHSMSVIDLPPSASLYPRHSLLTTMENGALGLARLRGSKLYLLSREDSPARDAAWELSRVIDLDTLLPADEHYFTVRNDMVGSADSAGIIS
ncbi:hypothetical protein PR202_ga28587 [Eleusine coracana subsp. coracana]|uniref:F-box domain-containing protein n=1 Tax=Eleusine coracana subsp. coracana TaxID=191504 RepID=A0AAV5DJJ2_ELECO|nr:hypothetical protein PR202_ga28587 [Eleusine coracana subsp. coracana]